MRCEGRAAPDLEGADVAFGRGGGFKASVSRVVHATSPKRPPGGGRALPGCRRADHLGDVATKHHSAGSGFFSAGAARFARASRMASRLDWKVT